MTTYQITIIAEMPDSKSLPDILLGKDELTLSEIASILPPKNKWKISQLEWNRPIFCDVDVYMRNGDSKINITLK